MQDENLTLYDDLVVDGEGWNPDNDLGADQDGNPADDLLVDQDEVEQDEPHKPDDDELREDDVLLTPAGACAFVGGEDKPIDPSTLYRQIREGRIRPPIHPTPGVARFIKRRLAADLNRNIAKGGK